MEAGLVEYRLCDRNLQCETCELDQALRHPVPASRPWPTTANHNADLLGMLRQLSFNPSAWYGRSFWVVEHAEANALHLGLNDTAVKLLPEILETIIPCCGSLVQAYQPAFYFATHQGLLTLRSPLNGTVMQINQNLMAELSRYKQAPTGTIRLTTLAPASSESIEHSWLNGRDAIEFLRQQQETVLDRFSQYLYAHQAELGQTSHDGGVQIEDLETAIGSSRYFAILQELFQP